jgi:protein tyrosine/serine phosphatase
MRFLALLILLASPAAFAGSYGLPSEVVLQKAESLIPNFRPVSPGVFRGGNPLPSLEDKRGLDVLKEVGISLVIDLQGVDVDDSASGWLASQMEPGETPEAIAEEKHYLESQGIRFLNLPFSSHQTVTKQAAATIDQVVKLLGKANAKAKVFVHCQHGKDRTGLVIALHRLENRGYTVKEAYDEWVAAGHDILSWTVTGRLDDYFFEVAQEGGYDLGI